MIIYPVIFRNRLTFFPPALPSLRSTVPTPPVRLERVHRAFCVQVLLPRQKRDDWRVNWIPRPQYLVAGERPIIFSNLIRVAEVVAVYRLNQHFPPLKTCWKIDSQSGFLCNQTLCKGISF